MSPVRRMPRGTSAALCFFLSVTRCFMIVTPLLSSSLFGRAGGRVGADRSFVGPLAGRLIFLSLCGSAHLRKFAPLPSLRPSCRVVGPPWSPPWCDQPFAPWINAINPDRTTRHRVTPSRPPAPLALPCFAVVLFATGNPWRWVACVFGA